MKMRSEKKEKGEDEDGKKGNVVCDVKKECNIS